MQLKSIRRIGVLHLEAEEDAPRGHFWATSSLAPTSPALNTSLVTTFRTRNEKVDQFWKWLVDKCHGRSAGTCLLSWILSRWFRCFLFRLRCRTSWLHQKRRWKGGLWGNDAETEKRRLMYIVRSESYCWYVHHGLIPLGSISPLIFEKDKSNPIVFGLRYPRLPWHGPFKEKTCEILFFENSPRKSLPNYLPSGKWGGSRHMGVDLVEGYHPFPPQLHESKKFTFFTYLFSFAPRFEFLVDRWFPFLFFLFGRSLLFHYNQPQIPNLRTLSYLVPQLHQKKLLRRPASFAR